MVTRELGAAPQKNCVHDKKERKQHHVSSTHAAMMHSRLRRPPPGRRGRRRRRHPRREPGARLLLLLLLLEQVPPGITKCVRQHQRIPMGPTPSTSPSRTALAAAATLLVLCYGRRSHRRRRHCWNRLPATAGYDATRLGRRVDSTEPRRWTPWGSVSHERWIRVGKRHFLSSPQPVGHHTLLSARSERTGRLRDRVTARFHRTFSRRRRPLSVAWNQLGILVALSHFH